MKLLLVFTFLALACIAQSAPWLTSDDDDENIIIDDATEDEMNTTTTTTATRRSTYVFPTRNRNTFPTRRPWLTQRTTSVRTTTRRSEDEIIDEMEDFNNQHGDIFKYFRNLRDFFKKFWEDMKKFIRNITGFDLIKAIKQLFGKKTEE